MKKPTIFDFYTWNPFKKGIHTAFVLRFRTKNQSDYPECYILISLMFCQLTIDFQEAYNKTKNYYNEKSK